jgi:hypothetical protein
LKKPLQRIAVGGVLAGGAFIISGFLELALMKTYEVVPVATEAHIEVMNSLSCNIGVLLSNSDGNVGDPHRIEGKANQGCRNSIHLSTNDFRV